ncbi:MAG: hypothetical protein Q8O86_08735 [Dehalococcoidia bacterium]|nr:hypothetical protein [Dehalococcoidia bacterium]
MDLTQKTRDFALQWDADLVGIAPVDRFENAPPGRRPQDLLPAARSVVAIGVVINKGVMNANRIAFHGLRHAIFPYMVYGYTQINDQLTAIAHHLSRMLEREGHVTLPIPPSSPADGLTSMAAFSNRHASVAAGLGQFGWNALLITPQVGSRLRLVSLITEADLRPDPLSTGEPICDVEKCRYACVRVCPTGALSIDKGAEFNIGGHEFRYGITDKWKCKLGVGGIAKGAMGVTQLPVPNEMTPELFLELSRKEDVWQRAEYAALGRTSYCGRCIEACPVGR